MEASEELFTEGDDFFSRIHILIQLAQKDIFVESYIVEDGTLTHSLLDELSLAVQRGVQVRLHFDSGGAHSYKKELVTFCKRNGIQLRFFHFVPFISWAWQLSRLNRRNHRKIWIFDKKTLAISSMNWSDTHCRSRIKIPAWKDFGLVCEDQRAAVVYESIDRTWQSSRLPVKIWKRRPLRFEERSKLGVFLNDSQINRRKSFQTFLQKINSAKTRIWIANAYVVPHVKMLRALREAALRGVEVRILSNDKSDVFFIPWVTRLIVRNFFQGSGKRSVKYYEMKDRFLHGKVFIIDDFFSCGSSNFNHRSFFHDLEIDCEIKTPLNQQVLLQDMTKQFQIAKEVTLDLKTKLTFWKLMIAKFLYYFRFWF